MNAKITISVILVSLSLSAFCKNVIPFWQEDFSLGSLPSGWLGYDTNDEPIIWQHCENYNLSPLMQLTQLGLFPDEQFNSRSMENGFAYIFPYNRGAANQHHESSLETGSIDCSNQSQVFLSFNTFIMSRYSDPRDSVFVEVRNGNSPFWMKFTVFPTLSQSQVENHPKFPEAPRIQSINGQFVCIDISAMAANMSDVHIRWTWSWTGTAEYCWLIDDVELLDENPLDVNALWGSQPGEGDFSNGLNGWSAVSNGACKWAWNANGLVDYPDPNDEADGYGCSCTVENGVALMDATCDPAAPTNYFSELISPVIDLSMVSADKRLGLRFHESGAVGNNNGANALPLTSIMVSVDGGQTFIDTIFLNLNEPFSKPFCKNTLVPLPLPVIGADEFVFKFVFSGSTFYWMIDDVRVVEMFDNDLRLSEDYFAVAPNYSIPAGLEQPIAFAAEVQNIGQLAQDFTTLYVEVVNDHTQERVFKDSLFLGTILPGETLEENMFSKKFKPAPEQSYTGFYTLVGDGEEENTADNKVTFRFNTRGSTYSKTIDRYAINGGFSVNTFNPRYEIGNCYYIPAGQSMSATAMQFAVANGQIYADAGLQVDVNLYRWKKGNNTGDVNGDGKANQNEFEKIATTEFSFEVAYSILDIIEVPFPSPIELEEETYYFITIDYWSPAIFNGQQVPFFIAASEQINYASMFEQSILCGQPAYTSMLRKSGENEFTSNAWGLLRTPYINLSLNKTTTVADPTADQLPIILYPNPTTGQMQLEILEGQFRNGIAYEVFDICGHLALPRQTVEGYVSQLPIDVSLLSNGLYNLRVVSESRVGVHRFVVEKTH